MSVWRIVALLLGIAGTAFAALAHRPAPRDERRAQRAAVRAARPEPGLGSDTLDGVPAEAYRRGTAAKVVTGVLVALGVIAIAWGAVLLVQTERPDQWLGLLLWLAAAIVLHDGILVPVITGLNRAFGGLGQRAPQLLVWVVRVALLVGGIVTLIVVPTIFAQRAGNANPTVLPNDYGRNLALFWAALIVVTAIVCAVVYLRTRRQNARPSTVQD